MRVVRRLGWALGLPLVLFVSWWFASENSQSFYFPPLSRILDTLVDEWLGPRLLEDVLPSLIRLSFGYLIAVVLGVCLGVAIGSKVRLRTAAEPLLEFFRAIPPPVLVPVLVLVAGFGDTTKVIVIVTGCIWPILLNTVEGVRALDPVMAETCRSYGLRGGARLWRFVLPGSSPQIMAGLRQGLSIAVIMMVISELFASTNGIGFAIVQFQRSFALPQMWSGIIVLGLLGVLLSAAFGVVERHVLSWYHDSRQAQRAGVGN